jgi:FtsZ-binding cell division protein ZapB
MIIYNIMSVSIEEYNILLLEIEKLKNKNNELEEHLKNYTNSKSHQKYYQNNKNIIKEKAKEYKEKIKYENPDKIKEYARRAYLKKKEKNDNENI